MKVQFEELFPWEFAQAIANAPIWALWLGIDLHHKPVAIATNCASVCNYNVRPTRRARGPRKERPAKEAGQAGQAAGFAPPKWLYSWLWVCSVLWASLRPSSRRYPANCTRDFPAPLHSGDFPAKLRRDFPYRVLGDPGKKRRDFPLTGTMSRAVGQHCYLTERNSYDNQN
jgi:hypothetical protein